MRPSCCSTLGPNSDGHASVGVRTCCPTVLGFAKFGFKSLFFYKPPKGNVIQADRCLCLLDFYVLEDFQRSGIGKALFEQFLKVSGDGRVHACGWQRQWGRSLPSHS